MKWKLPILLAVLLSSILLPEVQEGYCLKFGDSLKRPLDIWMYDLDWLAVRWRVSSIYYAKIEILKWWLLCVCAYNFLACSGILLGNYLNIATIMPCPSPTLIKHFSLYKSNWSQCGSGSIFVVADLSTVLDSDS